jgi:hypothetical protein
MGSRRIMMTTRSRSAPSATYTHLAVSDSREGECAVEFDKSPVFQIGGRSCKLLIRKVL